MATKERLTRETGACVRDCQSYRVKPAILRRMCWKKVVVYFSLTYMIELLFSNLLSRKGMLRSRAPSFS